MRNVVLLTVDSLRADHCSCFGYDRETTPRLDDLAAEGTAFARAYSPSSHTREAVASVLTGRYPHAAVDDGYRLAAPTLATRLADTHDSGAVHSNPFLSRAYGYDRDFDAFDDDLYLSRHKFVALAQRLFDRLRGHHYARAWTVNERALSWLDSRSGDDPFFLWAHYMDAHGPFEPPARYRDRFVDDDRSTRERKRLWYRSMADPDGFTDAERSALVDAYDGEVRYTDAAIGSLLDALADRGLLAETLVVVTADHGELFGESGRYGHPRYVAEKVLHVPLVLAGPDVPSTTIDVPVGTRDVVPTVLELLDRAGGDDRPGRDDQSGAVDRADRDRSLSRYWMDDAVADHVVSEARSDDETRRRYRVTGPDESLSFEHAIGENRADVPDLEPAPLAATLRAHLERVARSTSTGESSGDHPTVAEDRLEALGYK